MANAKVKEVALKTGRKAWFLRVTGKGRADLRSGLFLRILEAQKKQDAATTPAEIYEAANAVEALQAEVMAAQVCNAEGALLYASGEAYLADIDVDEHRALWNAFMSYVFGSPEDKPGN
jgi:hypothetical protein